MKIISLYPSNDVYQVVSEDESTIYYQGTLEECETFVKKNVVTEWDGPYAY
jgi:hypothetical protein